ncbi:MAG: hypothetical protein Kow0089_02070 [Desulfobulbaceae bacterium]
MRMKTGKKKKRLNLYLSDEAIRFAKDWSYVTGKPISRMLEEFLEQQRKVVERITPFQWLSDPECNPSLPGENEHFREMEEYLNNRREKEFCEQNPDHPRAKLRRTIIREYEEYQKTRVERQKVADKQLIQRWLERFPP